MLAKNTLGRDAHPDLSAFSALSSVQRSRRNLTATKNLDPGWPENFDWVTRSPFVVLSLAVEEKLASVGTANLQRATRLSQSSLEKAFTGKLL
jgi:hypothetical protein